MTNGHDPMEGFRKRLKALRIRDFKNQTEAAEALPGTVDQTTWSGWEIGPKMPDARTIVALADLFGVPVGWLLAEEGSPEEDPADDGRRLRVIAQIATRELTPDEIDLGIRLARREEFLPPDDAPPDGRQE